MVGIRTNFQILVIMLTGIHNPIVRILIFHVIFMDLLQLYL